MPERRWASNLHHHQSLFKFLFLHFHRETRRFCINFIKNDVPKFGLFAFTHPDVNRWFYYVKQIHISLFKEIPLHLLFCNEQKKKQIKKRTATACRTISISQCMSFVLSCSLGNESVEAIYSMAFLKVGYRIGLCT